MIITIPATTVHIGVQLSQEYAREMENNRKMILSCIQFLARQGLPLRGDGDEIDGNFLQLLKFQGQDDDVMLEWLQRKYNKYTSHEIQNDLLKIMALHVVRSIADHLQKSPFLTVMIDETSDISNQEQETVVIRRVDEGLSVYEEFLGLYCVDSIAADSLTAVIKDVMIRLNLSMSKLRGQCYDGCSTMSGIRTGELSVLHADEEPTAVFTHCYGHSLNLAASDTVKKSKLMKDALDTTHEITKLIKFSPRCNAN